MDVVVGRRNSTHIAMLLL